MSLRLKLLVGVMVFVAGLFLILFSADQISAATLTVDDDGGADYSSIQNAIDASAAGDTIRVHEGTYYENVVVDKSVSLIGNGSGNTTIYIEEEGNGIHVNADYVNVSGFRVTGTQVWRYLRNRTGILITSNHTRISGNNCTENSAGIDLEGDYENPCTHNTITNNTCSNNDDHNGETGISLYYAEQNILSNNSCYKNEGYGIYLRDSIHNTLSNNICKYSGSGIGLTMAGFNIISNNNCSHNYNGICVYHSWNNLLENNNCSNNKNGVSLYRSSSTENTVFQNVCLYNDESGILIFETYEPGNIIRDNNCSHNGFAGIEVLYSIENILENNTCSHNRYGIYLRYFNEYYKGISNNKLMRALKYCKI